MISEIFLPYLVYLKIIDPEKDASDHPRPTFYQTQSTRVVGPRLLSGSELPQNRRIPLTDGAEVAGGKGRFFPLVDTKA